MTAAVLPATSPDAFPTPGLAESGHPGHAGHPGGRADQHRFLMPYLAPVPDCEPPFDDEVGGRPRTRARRPSITFGDQSTTAAHEDPAHAGEFVTPVNTSRAQLTALFGDPSPADADPIEPASVRSANQRDPSTTRTRVPRQRRAEGLGKTAKSDVLLLSPSPTSRPTTVTSAGVPSWSSEADIGVRKTASQHLPPVGRAASVLARALVEVLSGQRPLAQLRVHCAPEIYAGLGDRLTNAPTALPHLLTVRVCEPADGVAEVSAAFRRADRVRALAFRVEGVDGRWRITALQLG